LLKRSIQANRLLAALPKDVLERLLPDIELVKLVAGDVLDYMDGGLKYAYFPADMIVTVLVLHGDNNSTKVALIGREGLVGIPAFMGNGSPHRHFVVLNTGDAYKIPAAALKTEFDRNGVAMRLLLRFAQTLITQMAQNAVCNRYHVVEQQLCSFLLMCIDRMPHNNTLPATQELVAGMLGVRREGVSEAVGKLRHLGLIASNRGHIRILDRPGLMANACECYLVVKRETDRLLPDQPAT
jgi:CRP-like cAMP-binding protein